MSAPNENGRPLAEALGTPVALVSGASPIPNACPQSNGFPRSMGATPFDPLDLLRAMDESATDGAIITAPRCHGAEDEAGNPICEGDGVAWYRFLAPGTLAWDVTEWCPACATQAESLGYLVLPMKPIAESYVVIDVAGDCAEPVEAIR